MINLTVHCHCWIDVDVSGSSGHPVSLDTAHRQRIAVSFELLQNDLLVAFRAVIERRSS